MQLKGNESSCYRINREEKKMPKVVIMISEKINAKKKKTTHGPLLQANFGAQDPYRHLIND